MRDHGAVMNAQAHWQIPGLESSDRLVAGVAAAIGRELGVAAFLVRASFVALFMAGGWGAVLYLVSWLALVWAQSAGLTGDAEPVPKARSEQLRLLGFAVLSLGLISGAASFSGIRAGVLWPLALAIVGMVAVHRQASARSTERRTGPKGYLELLVGLALIGVATVALAAGFSSGASRFLVVGVIVVALVIVVGSSPWWWRIVQDLDHERQARVRSEERAEVAAHLHDSVLQTLSLIQKADGDPQRMSYLARRQERELRNWLDPNRASRSGASVRGQMDNMASDIEELYETPVEIVAVGDCLVDPQIEAVLGATREAVVNAAKHSGAPRVDVYFEITEEEIAVYVRDTGTGFARSSVTSDRRGISASIEGRMERVGGLAEVASVIGEGTEVELRLARDPAHSGPYPAHRSGLAQGLGQSRPISQPQPATDPPER